MSNAEENYFIKSSEKPLSTLTREQKAQLNRRGNVLFNEGNIDAAKRIFLTTGYSDGLSRVGDYALDNRDYLQAWKLYMLAHDRAKEQKLSADIAEVVRLLLREP